MAEGRRKVNDVHHGAKPQQSMDAPVEQPPDEPNCFPSNDELIEAAHNMVLLRVKMDGSGPEDGDRREHLRALERRWTDFWHGSMEKTGETVPLTARLRPLGLDPVEREIVAVLLLDRLGILEQRRTSPSEILKLVSVPRGGTMSALRSMSKDGHLAQTDLISHTDPRDDLCDQQIVLDPTLVECALTGQDGGQAGWDVETEEELYDRVEPLSRAYEAKSTVLNRCSRGHIPIDNREDAYRLSRRIVRLRGRLEATLERHADWGLARLLGLDPPLGDRRTDVILALLAKELGHVPPGNSLFTGKGLACVLARDEDRIRRHLRLFGSDARLVRECLIRPAGGSAELVSDEPAALADAEFELGDRSLELLELEGRRRRQTDGSSEVRKPRVSFDQLVLSPEVHESLEMVLAQAHNQDTLYENWGLAQVVPYGRGLTLLFSGPPGVGKTASAEALADRLDLPILVTDYSQVQNCWVGQTEKNIVRTFWVARATDAVLFWDEADAMFYDRDSGFRNYEVRQVNVLLQQIERFEGICILATNRKTSLDRALERRIAMKVEFERPDRRMRRRIWGKLIPDAMPLADDVDLEKLSEADLTGGEIKNAVLNAARLAIAGKEGAQITMQHLRKAVRMEKEGKWKKGRGSPVGFTVDAS